MTERAFASYQHAREHQLLRNDARRIRTRVKEARDNPIDAGGRWPFELLQNASDAGAREGAAGISVRLGWEESDARRTVYFEHDGAPFASQDVAALLSGGSSKEFDSATTTGRFGTGFLVTHVLSHRVSVRGVLLVDGGLEEFELLLDRSGDEDAILASTLATDAALRTATPIELEKSTPSARFAWSVDEFATYERGVTALEEALPFIFGTCQSLERVEIRRADGSQVTYLATAPTDHSEDGIRWVTRPLLRSSVEAEPSRFEVVRVFADPDGRTGAVFVVQQDETSAALRDMPPGLARVFRRFPIRGTGNLPLGMVIDGPFDVDQERRSIALAADDKVLIEAALAAVVSAVRVAFLKNVVGGHRLASIAPLVGANSAEEAEWWSSTLRDVANKLATLPIIATRSGMLPALKIDSMDRYADFPRPRLDLASKVDELPLDRVWRLMDGISTCDPPDEGLASEWSSIAHGWAELGVDVREVTLATLAGDARGAKTLDALESLATAEWLPDFLDAIGLAWDARGGSDSAILNGLLPNQEGTLCDPAKLERDGGVPEELKDLADELGVGVRPLLLDLRVATAAADPRWVHLLSAIERALPRTRTKEAVVEACIKRIDALLPLQRRLDADGRRTATLACRFLAFVWRDAGPSAASLAARVPLLTANGDCDRGGPTKKMMLPAQTWRARSRAYVDAWPRARVLDDVFASEPLPEALATWNIAFRDPLTELRASELRGARLAAMTISPVPPPEGLALSVQDEVFTSIALLQPEVLNRCQESREHAKLLMGFVVDCLAREDDSWRSAKTITARRDGADQTFSVRNALWLGDLHSRSWVPAVGDDGSLVKVPPSAATLRGLLDPAWLVDNPAAIDLLTDCFGFDALELQLLGATSSDVERQALRDQLARIVQASEGRLDLLEAVMTEVEARRSRENKVQALRNFGLAVQEAVRLALKEHGLDVALIDHGFDFAVAVADQDALEDLALAEFEVDEWLVEVKATTRGEVALTPLQARTAATRPQRFVLCVVPLVDVPDENADVSELVEMVRERARMVTDIGPDAAATTALVDSAVRGQVGLRNDQQLRYAVREPRWRHGLSLADWVAALVKETLTAPVEAAPA